MGQHKSPFDDRIYLPWKAIAFEKTGLTDVEKRENWRTLYETAFVDGAWTCNTPSTGLVTSMGITFALQDGRYDDAEALAVSLLSLPDVGDHEIEAAHHWSRLGVAYWLRGEKARAMEHWGNLESESKSRRGAWYAIELWSVVRNILGETHIDGPCDADLRTFVIRFVGWFPSQKRNSARLVKAQTNQDLCDGLDRLKQPLSSNVRRRMTTEKARTQQVP